MTYSAQAGCNGYSTKRPKQISAAMAMLLEAHNCAQDLSRDAWDFAIEIDNLHALGITNNGLRWLIGKGYVHHAAEDCDPAVAVRKFKPLGELILTPITCFVLTEKGVTFARSLDTNSQERLNGVTTIEVADTHHLPVWDSDLQELRLRGVRIKQFKVPAPNQELILAAFEEEHWPPRIDDPLPPAPGLDAKRRLHETITSLNRNQKHALISFHGDGSGQGVRWHLADRSLHRVQAR